MKSIYLRTLILGLAFVGFACTRSAKQEETAVKSDSTGKNPIVEMKTSAGTIVIELDAKKAPKSVENFMGYVNSGFYNGTIFHRVIDGFMIQGGGFDKAMTQKPTKAPIENEASNGLSNAPMTLAMARTNDPNSATAQFFINLVDNKRLDYVSNMNPGYAVFGKVIEGEDVVKKIGKVKTGSKGFFSDVPTETIEIESVKVRP